MKTVVIKVGGAFLSEPTIAMAFLQQLQLLKKQLRIVIVHGGGDIVEQQLSLMGLNSEKYNGLRVTPASQIPYVVGALAGTANKQLVSIALANNLNAVGLCLADGCTSLCEKVDENLGEVGRITNGKSDLLNLLLDNHYIPIVSSIGVDTQGNLLNVNADQAATSIAAIMQAELLLLSNVPGVLDQNKNLLEQLTPVQVEELISKNVITDGMIVKVHAAQQAADTLQKPVTIASWQTPDELHQLVEESQSGSNRTSFGTAIFPNTHQEAS